ncbi:MAG TPA: RDD family protein [Tepidisphaeraceae bacterium]|jgi:uncharacterized RDD family membrane protein YckC
MKTELAYLNPQEAIAMRASVGRRVAALLLDLLFTAPLIGVLGLVGSFYSEATHQRTSVFYVIAALFAALYLLTEIVLAATPGMMIVRLRIVQSGGAEAPVPKLLLRWCWKYYALLLWVAVGLLLERTHMVRWEAVGRLAVLVGLAVPSVPVVFLVALVRSLLRRAGEPLWFDQFSGTSVWFTSGRA